VVDRHIPQLVETGYRYVQEFERAIPDRRYLVKVQGHPGHFTCTPWCTTRRSGRTTWLSATSCARIRASPCATGGSRSALAARHRNDRAAYTEGKAEFIKNALATRKA
jgi:hypothetical protein